MRHIRTRRRYRILLFFLLAFCITLFIESRIEALIPELKAYAESRVEKALGGKIDLFIGSMDGGIMQPIVLNDVRVEQGKGSLLFQSLTINNIRTTYRVWDLLKMRSAPAVSDILEKDSAIYVNFSLRNGAIEGFVGIEGGLIDSKVSGYVKLPDKEKVEFTGTVKGDTFNVTIRPKAGSIRLTGSISDAGDLTADFKISHMKFRGIDVVCDGYVKNRVIPDADGRKSGRMEGQLETRELVINDAPFFEVKTAYNISDGVIKISELTLGDGVKASGSVWLKEPNAIDLKVLVNNVSLTRILQQLGIKDTSSIVTGTLNGKFVFKGTLAKMRVESHFDMRKGTMGTLDFDSLAANVKGDLPFLKIEDATVTRQSGYFSLAGELDLRKSGTAGMFSDVRLVTDDGAITWDEWSYVKRHDVREISMARSITSDIGIRYKKFVNEGKIDESVRDNDQVRLEYKLSPNESLGMMIGQDQDYFGFEHRDKF